MASGKEVLGGLMIAIIAVVLFTIVPIIGYETDSATDIQTNVAATGTLTATNTVTAGEIVNISTETYTFTNGTGGAFNVDLGAGTGNQTYAVTQLIAEITANSTLVSATSGGAGIATVTSLVTGSAGNAYTTTENMTNGAWGSATLTGGVDGSQWDSVTNTDIPTGVDLWESVGSVATLVIIMSMLFLVIAMIFVLYRKYA